MADSADKKLRIHPVILSGGSGTRLWPVSRSLYPKQLLPLATDRSMLQETALRIAGPDFAAPLVICNVEHRFIIAEQLRELGITPAAILIEPVGRNTAPAVAVAAHFLARDLEETLMLVLPSDHLIADDAAFQRAVATAAQAAASGRLVTFGMTPDCPETGYGYIRRGDPLDGLEGCFAVSSFVEKPDRATAEGYLVDGGYVWNSGMFLFRADTFMAELTRFNPEITNGCQSAVDDGQNDFDFFRLDEEAFTACPSLSVDYAVMEKTNRAAVVPAALGWNDIGSWAALWENGAKDAGGNSLQGDVVVHDVRGSYIRSDGTLVAALGIEDAVIVVTDDAVLVTTRDRAPDIPLLVKELKARGRSETDAHSRVYRPWGYYQTVDTGLTFQVKHLMVKPGAKLSLQSHDKRAEHWVVVSGTAEVTHGADILNLGPNQSTYIPRGTKHRLANLGDEPLRVIEVQSGSYLGEDDIVRYDDDYGREGDKT
jgi:mannose-1-phosphate guanylyltransferase/mannose-6-phosphate isomerase